MSGTLITIEDRSVISNMQIHDNIDRPVVFAAFSADRGTEDYRAYKGKEFFEQYGNPSFARHGQPLLQAANVINNGGIVYAKRIVADDAKLALLGVYAHVTSKETDKKTIKMDENGNPVFETDALGTSIPVMEKAYKVKADYVKFLKNPADKDTLFGESQLTNKNTAIWKTKDGEPTAVVDDLASFADAEALGDAVKQNTALISYHASTVDPSYYGDDSGGGEKIGRGARANDVNRLSRFWLRSLNKQLLGTETDSTADLAAKNIFPLFIIADSGRGVSRKSFRIEGDPLLGRTAESARLRLQIIEDNVILEGMIFSLYPDEIQSGYNLFLGNVLGRASRQVRGVCFEDEIYAFYDKLEDISKLSHSDLVSADLFSCRDFRGRDLGAIKLVDDIEVTNLTEHHADAVPTVNLGAINGHQLLVGDQVQGEISKTANGAFGDRPIKLLTEFNKAYSSSFEEDGRMNEYVRQLKAAFDGTADDTIFNIDNTPIDVIVDADYPIPVKDAIEQLCEFRQDVFFFRDMGLYMDSDVAIRTRIIKRGGRNVSRYCADYCQAYEVLDPYTKKQIKVTIGYDIARLICMHWANGRNLVLAGESNGWIIDDIIPNTLNFAPKKVPGLDQTQLMKDLRINYGCYFNGVFSLCSEYTAQNRYTQLSFINNVLIVQELIKDIRRECPKNRYQFITGKDFERYKAEVDRIIDRRRSEFKSISIEFQNNAVYAANKIVYAVIKVEFKDFAQEEVFKIIALPIDGVIAGGASEINA